MTTEALEQELALIDTFVMQFGETYLSDEGRKGWHGLRNERDNRSQRERSRL